MANTFFANVKALKYDTHFAVRTQAFVASTYTVPVGKYALISYIQVGSSIDNVEFIFPGGYAVQYNTATTSAEGATKLGGVYLPGGTVINIPAFNSAASMVVGLLFANTG